MSAHSRYAAVPMALAIAALLPCGPVAAQSSITVQLAPVADTTVFQESPDHASARGGSAFTGNNAGGYARRALMRFDLSAIPAGSTIVSATLGISVDKVPPGLQSSTGRLHRLLNSWGTGTSNSGSNGGGAIATTNDATWSHRFWGTTQVWTAPGGGGDFVLTPSGAIAMSLLGRSVWSGAGVRADVQLWVDQPTQNFGWAILGEETLDKTAHRFGASEFTTVSARPRLDIEYQPPAPAPAAARENDVPLPEWATVALGATVISLLVRRRARRVLNQTGGSTRRDSE